MGNLFGNSNINNINNIKQINIINEKVKVTSLIKLEKELSFACGLANGIIKIYSRKLFFEFQLELKVHKRVIFNISETKNGELISCSSDRTIKISSYNLKEKKYDIIKIFIGHNDNINKVIEIEDYNKNKLYASCSDDRTIRIWNRETNEKNCQSISIFLNEDIILDLIELTNFIILFTLSDSSGLFILNYKIGILEKKRNDISCDGIYGICKIKNSNLIAISSLGNIYIIEDKNFQIKKYLNSYLDFYFWCVNLLNDGSLITSGTGNEIFQWDIEEEKLIGKKNIHNNFIPCVIEIENNILISCSYDCTIKFWKFINI